jgi:hypothetical protein
MVLIELKVFLTRIMQIQIRLNTVYLVLCNATFILLG